MTDSPRCPFDDPICMVDVRLAEMEKARIEREARLNAQLAEMSKKLDDLIADRQTLMGVVWAVRILFGAFGAVVIFLLTHAPPEWLKRALQ